MTDIIKPTDYTVIGGVRYNSNDVKSSERTEKRGKTQHSVYLNNGVHLEYPNQKGKSSVFMKDVKSAGAGPATMTNISDLEGALIEGTQGTDFIHIRGGRNNTVDVSKDSKNDTVAFFDSDENLSQGNKVITNVGDDAGFRTKHADVDIQGAGITSEQSVSEPESGFFDKMGNAVKKGINKLGHMMGADTAAQKVKDAYNNL